MKSAPRQAAPAAAPDTSAVAESADGTQALRSTSATVGTRGAAVPGTGPDAATPTERSAAPAAAADD